MTTTNNHKIYEHSCSREKIFHCWIAAIFDHKQLPIVFFTTAGFVTGKFQTFFTEAMGIAFWEKQGMYPGNDITKDEPIGYYF
jgi:hypothetical protein